MTHQPSDELWNKLATSLGIEVPVLKAVAYVESSGSGFLPSSSKPKVLFEGHVFHRLTGGIYDDEYPNLSYRKWSREKYSGSLAGEWRRLEAACQLNRPAALQSASWGMFQIMGFNYAYCGAPTSKPSSRCNTRASTSRPSASRVSLRVRRSSRR